MNEPLEQQLWELIYEVLPEDEAEALCQRVRSDPAVARAYSRIKLQSQLVADAARIHDIPETFERPEADAPPPDPFVERRRRRYRTATNWLLALAASALLCITGYAYYGPHAPLSTAAVEKQTRAFAEQQIRTVVTTPAVLHADLTNPLTVETARWDGRPTSTDVDVRVYDPRGGLQLFQTRRTKADGSTLVDLPGSLLHEGFRIEVSAAGSNPVPVTAQPGLIDSGNLCYLSLDRPFYRPGETVYFRSLTLSRFYLAPVKPMPVAFEILDAAGNVVPRSRFERKTEKGVAHGTFDLAPDMAGGNFTLVVRSPDNEFDTQQRDFVVRRYTLPRLNKKLTFHRDSYAPGDEVVAEFSVRRVEGGALAGGKLNISAFVDQRPLELENAQAATDDDGKLGVRFALPAGIQRGDGWLTVQVTDGAVQEQIGKAIPIQLGQIGVELYPEGGDLVAGLLGRVYFHARNSLRRPVHVEGRVVDENDQTVARVQTGHTGRGVFEFTPRPGAAYRLVVDKPAGSTTPIALPPARSDRFLTLNATPGVFAASSPIEVMLQAREVTQPLVVSAACRGGLVGLKRIETSDFVRGPGGPARCPVSLRLSPEASGVVRITVYDFGSSPARPIAERLVFRRATQQMRVRVEGLAAAYDPGDEVQCEVVLTNEKGEPQDGIAGISVVNEALLDYAGQPPPQLETSFYLLNEIRRPAELEDANFYLGDHDDAARALDLLLGTQGWRRFVELDVDAFAYAETAADKQLADQRKYGDRALAESLGAVAESLTPLVLDNQLGIQRALEQASLTLQQSRAQLQRRLGGIALGCGLALIIVALLVGVVRKWAKVRVWAPSLVVAAACSVLGLLWMGAHVDPPSQVADRTLSERPAEDSAPVDAPSAAVDMLAETEESLEMQQQEMRLESKSLDAPLAAEGDEMSADVAGEPEAEAAAEEAPRNAGQRSRATRQAAAAAAAAPQPTQPMPAGGRESEQLERRQDRALGVAAPLEKARPLVRSIAPVADAESAADPAAAGRPDRLEYFAREYANLAVPPEPTRDAEDNPATPYWAPRVRVDDSGRTQILFSLPADVVTTFFLQVDAHSVGRIGSGESRLHIRQP